MKRGDGIAVLWDVVAAEFDVGMHENPFNPWLDAFDERLGVRVSRVAAPLLMASMVACGIVFFEVFVQQRARQFYLLKNLFLGWLPLGFALIWYRGRMLRKAAGQESVSWGSRALEGVWLASWLFFLPNAPYMVTDLIHSYGRSPDRFWTDMLKISIFAFTSLAAGHLSLAFIHKSVRETWGWGVGWSFVVLISALSSIGVWLGRFRRWNTWDLLHQPGGIFEDTLELAQGVYQNPSGAYFPVLMFFLILCSYGMMYGMKHGKWWGVEAMGEPGVASGVSAVGPISEGVPARSKRVE